MGCDRVTRHEVFQEQAQLRSGFVELTQWKNVGTYARCVECDVGGFIDPRDFDGFLPLHEAMRLSSDELIEQTNPGATRRLVRLRSAPMRWEAGKALPEDRIQEIQDLVIAIELTCGRRVTVEHVDWLTLMLVIGAFAALVAGLVITDPTAGKPNSPLGMACYCVCGALFVCAGWALGTDLKRHVRRKYVRRLRARMAEFMPFREEIDIAFDRLHAMGVRVSRLINHKRIADRLWDER